MFLISKVRSKIGGKGGRKRMKLTLRVKGGWQPSSSEESAFIMRTRTLGRRKRHETSGELPIIFGVGQPRLNVSSGFWGDRREARLGMVQNRRRRPRVASMAFRWHNCAKTDVESRLAMVSWELEDTEAQSTVG